MSGNTPESDTPPMVFIVIGKARPANETVMIPFNALTIAPDDDTAVRLILESLAQEGYEEADLLQIGNIDERPDEEQFRAAYDSALSGDIALILFEPDDDDDTQGNPTVH